MNKEFLIEILKSLYLVRDGLLDDSSRAYAAYNLGMITASIENVLEFEDEEKEFGHT